MTGGMVNHSAKCRGCFVDELLSRIADIVPRLQGWCTVEKAQWLARRIVEEKYQNVVEIGVFGGRSLVPMAMAMEHLYRVSGVKDGIIDGIDAYRNDVAEAEELDPANKGWWKSIDLNSIYKAAQTAVISQRVGAFVNFQLCSSEQGVAKFADESLDLVHVDGSHNEAASTRDVKIWWPKLRPGGIMVMDDTDWKQLVAARSLVASLGKLLHHDEKWEVYQKESSQQ